jgi:hypothetical protein
MLTISTAYQTEKVTLYERAIVLSELCELALEVLRHSSAIKTFTLHN